MVIQCPECTTQYNLAEDRLGPAGKNVRCARCGAVFFAGSSAVADTAEDLLTDDLTASASETVASDTSIEDAFDFSAISTPDEPSVTETLDDGYDDGFVTELFDEDELAAEAGLDDPFMGEELSASLDDSLADLGSDDVTLDDSLSDLESDSLELDDAQPLVEARPKRSPMSTVLLIILLLLLALIAGTGYLMITDGVDAPLRFIERLLAD